MGNGVGHGVPTLTRVVRPQLRRRGTEARLVLTAGDAAKKPDVPLLKTIAKARAWFEAISAGGARSLVEIAMHEGVTGKYVGNLISLAFLAPTVVEAIAAGRQPVELTAKALIARARTLPRDWVAQARQLGLR